MDTKFAARWLWLGVAALAFAGVFAVVLVAARTPQLAAFTQLFSVALVVHVDLSVLLWFLCIGGMGWSLLLARTKRTWPYWQPTAFYLVAAAMVCMVLSPLVKPWGVIKSNYIPVLDNQLFLMALVLLASGLAVIILQVLITYFRASARRKLSYSELGWLYAALFTCMALDAFFFSGYLVTPSDGRATQFEQLFWAGGHLLQFTYCALMMGAWLVLVKEVTGREVTSFAVFIAFALLAAAAIYSYAGFALFPGDLLAVNAHATRVMIELLGIGPVLMAGIILGPLVRSLAEKKKNQKPKRVYAATLVMSLLLFAFGGVLGLMISGQNVTIPAHYHGSIVGVTLALMGVAYIKLPEFGYASVADSRLAFWQPIIYGVGQLMHIGGLAYSGGYGVLRKAPDAAGTLAPNLKIAMGIMGLGGLLAIIGGLVFVVVAIRALKQPRRVEKQ